MANAIHLDFGTSSLRPEHDMLGVGVRTRRASIGIIDIRVPEIAGGKQVPVGHDPPSHRKAHRAIDALVGQRGIK
ncbi:hypothetical protein [Corynebacterium striatum]|uniref:hypothetical protein n=1 Tax=Corynebacterium striatum TaxID=43770 RepID=UPI001177BB0B|nr:hypothetical protein [Corynebacterium striatum]